jgi:hypothetical protein
MSTAKPTGGASTGTQTQNPLQALLSFGQSVWLDYIRRNLIETGELARMIREESVHIRESDRRQYGLRANARGAFLAR